MKHAIIWGAAGGIGKALTEQLVREHFKAVAISRRPHDLETITPHVLTADVTQPSQVALAARLAGDLIPGFDLFVYTVGDIMAVKIAELSAEDWNRILSVNLTGAFLTVQASLPLLTSNAHIVFIGANHERLRLPGLSTYAAAKAGLEVFAEVLRKETRRKILVVRPGAVQTPLWSKVPFPLPKNALLPEAMARLIYAAILEGKEGVLDL